VKLSATGKGWLLHYHCSNAFRNITHVRVRYINRKILWEASLLSQFTLTDVYVHQTRERQMCPTTDVQFQVKTGNFRFAIMQSHIQRCLLNFSQDGGRSVWNRRHLCLQPMVKKQLLATSCLSVCLCEWNTATSPKIIFKKFHIQGLTTDFRHVSLAFQIWHR
jgi:hypothetical protein